MATNRLLKDDVIRLRKDGLTIDEISKKLNCSYSTVKYHCKVNNLVKKFTLTENQFDDLKNDIKCGMKQKDASEKYKISVSSVKRYLKCDYKDIIKHREYHSNKMKDYRKELKIKAVEYKGTKCQNCGYNKCIEALVFHHINEKEKDFQLSGRNIKWEKMKSEIDKCLLVCHNCHSEIHMEIKEKGYSDIVNNIISNK